MVMGPSTAMILADLGAEVIKIEPRETGDKTRHLPGSGSGLFIAFNRNKKSVQADLRNPDDAEAIKKLLQTADVMIENFRSGKMDSLGFGYSDLKKTNPGLIYCSLKGFLPGPYGNRSALDEVVQMLGGLAYMTGPPGRPLRAGASVNDIMGGMFGIIGILAALKQRERTGEGAHITSSLFETTTFLVSTHMLEAQMTGKDVAPMPARNPSWAIYDTFKDRNGRDIFLAAVSDSQWKSLCKAFGLSSLEADRSLDSNAERVLRRDHIHTVLQDRLAKLELEEIEKLSDAHGIPYARVNRPQDLITDRHLNESDGLEELIAPNGHKVFTPRLPISYNGTRFKKRTEIPQVGANDKEFQIFWNKE